MDRAIAAVAPRLALERERARLRLAMVDKTKAEFDGATLGRRALGWRRSLRSANGELTPAVMNALRGVSHDLVRNNPYAARGKQAWAEHLVGTGITFQVYRRVNGKAEIDEKLTDLARRHFDSTACDAEGRHDLYGLQLQAAGAMVESGAAITRRRWRRASDGLPLPFQMQVLEPDYIDMSKDGPLDGGHMVNGIEFDPIGRRKQYWMRSGHPGERRLFIFETKPVPAEDVIHCYRADRPEQQHGTPWFAPVIMRMRDFADFEDARLMREKIASCFSVFTTDSEGDIGDAQPTPTSPEGGDGSMIEALEPGIIEHLPPGRDVKFATPPGVEGYLDFSRVSLRAVGAGLLGLPYELLTGDLTGVSFISGRLGRLAFRRSVSTIQWLSFIPQFCGGAERWFFDAAEMMGHNVKDAYFEWTPPSFEMTDPASEIPAIRDAIRSGQMNLSEAIRERGRDPDKHFAERAADNRLIDDLKLVLDSDPRKVTAVGNPAAPPASGTERK
ncbi:MAG TPA: phage portal protein [Allosphingosinicella sp.]|nr:phage portal protein [Allosphingosinicella sp.]